VHALGGFVTTFTGDEVGLDQRESAEDVARTLHQSHAVIALRVRDHNVLTRMVSATRCEARLINLLSDVEHPTQAIADILTLADRFERISFDFSGLTVTYLGDANNVTRSLAAAVVRLGGRVRIASPAGHELDDAAIAAIEAGAVGNGGVEVSDDPRAAARGSDALYTDVWVSMGATTPNDTDALVPFRITEDLLALASPRAVIMHCLPAHRGEEIADDVMDSAASVVWAQVRHRANAMIGALRWVKEESA
jgi:ornithine carbamoyltransferase